MVLDEEKSFEVLREIFLSENNQKLEDLEKEFKDFRFLINDTEYQISTLYPIIDKIIDRKIIHSKSELTQSISPILGPAIKNQIAESKDEIIDALFPIIGEIIKKAVAEKVKEVYQSLNAKIEATLQKGIFSKLIKSKISGVSANDLILQDAFPFALKEIFLIHEKSGILISHISASESNKSLDADLISGMLTAIKNFVSESFVNESGNQNLYEIQYGESKIILERGRYSYLAAVILGQEPVNFRENLTDVNNDIHKNFYKKLRDFDGEINKLENIDSPIKDLFATANKNEIVKSETKNPPLLLYAFGLLLAIVLIIIGVFTIPNYISEKMISNKVEEKLEIFNSADIKNLTWKVEDNAILLDGTVASILIKNKIDSVISTIPEIKNVDSKLGIILPIIEENEMAKNIRNLLAELSSNSNRDIKFSIDKDKVTVWGNVISKDEKLILGNKISEIAGVRILINNLDVILLSDSESLKLLNNLKLNYEFNETSINNEHLKELYPILPFLVRNNNLNFNVIGISDNSGDKIINDIKTKERIENLLNFLSSVGINKKRISITFAENNNSGRRIEFKVNAQREF